MNSLPPWFHRLPDILRQLELLPADAYLDRTACEVLFDLRQTAAGNLLRGIGAQRAGKSLIISRVALLKYLRRLQRDPSIEGRVAGVRRVAEVLKEGDKLAAARAVKIQPRPELEGLRVDELPGVTLVTLDRTWSLQIQGVDGLDLIQKLYTLSQAIASNPDGFLAGRHPVTDFEALAGMIPDEDLDDFIAEMHPSPSRPLRWWQDYGSLRSGAAPSGRAQTGQPSTALLPLRKPSDSLYSKPRYCTLSGLVRVLWAKEN